MQIPLCPKTWKCLGVLALSLPSQWIGITVLLFSFQGGAESLAQRGDLSILPHGSRPAPIVFSHFSDRLHALVFRNWNIVDAGRIAATVGATRDQILAIGESMGLPSAQPIPDEYRQRLYLTVIRRNWHLLPYDQLLELLDLTAEELATILREDDFLFVKLGQLKPSCEPIRYEVPTPATVLRAARIKSTLRMTFGDELSKTAIPRFQFIRDFNRPRAASEDPIDRSLDPRSSSGARFSTRYVYSYVALFGDPLLDETIDPFPDGLLERLSAVGVNGVWLHVVLRDLAPGGKNFPEFGRGHEVRLANLRKLARRAAEHGIGVYLYQNEPRAMPNAFFRNRPEAAGVVEGDFTALCTSSPQVREWITEALAHVFREVPELAGVFTISASENLTNCASHGQQQSCPHCRSRTAAEVISEVNRAIRDGVHRSKPDAKVIVWDWGWNGHQDATDHIDLLPDQTWLMSVSEWGLPIQRGGVQSEIGEYSLSAVGPGPRASQHWRVARERGLKTLAKVQLNNSWELAAVPYLPVLDLVAEHCHNLASAGVDGLMMSWSLGGYPSLNLEVAQGFDADPLPAVETVLRDIAVRHFGVAGAANARAAWREFSAAFREYPYHANVVYNGPQLCGPANLLFLQATGYRATMTGFAYDDLNSWRGPYPAEVYIQQFERVAQGWNKGVSLLEEAAAAAPLDRRAEVQADLRVAQAAQLHFQSVVNQAKFIVCRDRANAVAATDQQRESAKSQMLAILTEETRIARQMFELTAQDSRIGFEASNQYLYLPGDFLEKVLNCQWLEQQIQTEGVQAR
jgi:hypothetical protein